VREKIESCPWPVNHRRARSGRVEIATSDNFLPGVIVVGLLRSFRSIMPNGIRVTRANRRLTLDRKMLPKHSVNHRPLWRPRYYLTGNGIIPMPGGCLGHSHNQSQKGYASRGAERKERG
jgi:hypothetical protein